MVVPPFVQAASHCFVYFGMLTNKKEATISGFVLRMLQARQEMESYFGNGTNEEKLLLKKIDKRISDLYNHGFMLAGLTLFLFVTKHCIRIGVSFQVHSIRI